MNKVLICSVLVLDLRQEIILVDYSKSQAEVISRPFTEDLPEAIVEICDETQIYDFLLDAPETYAKHIIEVVSNKDPKINIHYLQGEK
jgi:hypothetical protein